MELEFREWVIEEGFFNKVFKGAIPMMALGGILTLSLGNKNVTMPQQEKPIIQVLPDEIGVRIPESEQRGFEFFLKDFKVEDVKIISLRSNSTKFGANASLQVLLAPFDINKRVKETLEKEAEYGFKSLPTGTETDFDKKQELPKKIIRVILEDFPVMTGSPYDPILIKGSVRLNLTAGEAWIAPSKKSE